MTTSQEHPASSVLPSNHEGEPQFKTWLCILCGFIYSERDGMPDEGIAPGTRWEDVPGDWICSECGAGKSDFEMVEV